MPHFPRRKGPGHMGTQLVDIGRLIRPSLVAALAPPPPPPAPARPSRGFPPAVVLAVRQHAAWDRWPASRIARELGLGQKQVECLLRYITHLSIDPGQPPIGYVPKP